MRMRRSNSDRNCGSRFTVRGSWFAVRNLPWSVMSLLFSCVVRLHARRDEDSKWVAGAARAGGHPDVDQTRVRQNLFQSCRREPETSIAEAIAHPGLFVLPQVKHEGPAAGHENANGLSHHTRRIFGMMQR